MKVILTRRPNGLYLLTHRPPVIAEVGSTGELDAYAATGDPLAMPYICEWAAKHIFHVGDLEPLQSQRVHLSGVPISEKFFKEKRNAS